MTLHLSHVPNNEDTEVARINADGTVFYHWELIERLACEWQPFDRDIARCVAKLLLPFKPTERSDRAERILAALRKPSEALVEATAAAEVPRTWPTLSEADRAALRFIARTTIVAAVAAAEKEATA